MRRTRLAPMSTKRRAAQRLWVARRRVVLVRDGSACVICSRHATDVHHRKQRSCGGSDETANLVGLCRFHHSDVHAHIELYRPLGLLLDSWEPEDMPMWHERGNRWCVPGDEYEWLPGQPWTASAVERLRGHLIRQQVHTVIGRLS